MHVKCLAQALLKILYNKHYENLCKIPLLQDTWSWVLLFCWVRGRGALSCSPTCLCSNPSSFLFPLDLSPPLSGSFLISSTWEFRSFRRNCSMYNCVFEVSGSMGGGQVRSLSCRHLGPELRIFALSLRKGNT